LSDVGREKEEMRVEQAHANDHTNLSKRLIED
jgi:hypothetical protein